MWFMAHPWMTLFLGILLLIIIEEAIANICNVFNNRSKLKQFEIMIKDDRYSKEEIATSFNKGKENR